MDCESTGPVSVDARGLFPNPKGGQFYNTPDRFFSRMSFSNGVELLYFAALKERARYGQVEDHQKTTPAQVDWLFGHDVPDEIKSYDRNGIMFLGDKGRVFVNRGGVYGTPVDELKDNPLPNNAWRVRASDNHMANFIECVKSRQEPVSPVRVQQRSITSCHLTNISLRLGRRLQWDPSAEQFVGDAEANSWVKRTQRAPYTIKS